tara:strand:- start:57 stop:527 length:471 start_codon:yes stop_codon:yes gene_type:complete
MNINSELSVESNEIYNESDKNEEEEKISENEEEQLIDDEDNQNNEENKESEKKICGFNNFKEEVDKLDVDSFDRTSEYSYESIPEINETKKSINYLYIISFLIGVFLIYYFYSGNIFITIIELILNGIFPYIYIIVKLFLIKGKLVEKIKGIENNK